MSGKNKDHASRQVELVHQAMGGNTRNTARTRGSLVAKLAWFLLFGIILFVLNQLCFAWQEEINSLKIPFPIAHNGLMENTSALRKL